MKTIKIDRQCVTPSRIESVGAVRFYRLLFWRDDLQMYSPCARPSASGAGLGAPASHFEAVSGLGRAQGLARLYREYGWIVILQPFTAVVPLSFPIY